MNEFEDKKTTNSDETQQPIIQILPKSAKIEEPQKVQEEQPVIQILPKGVEPQPAPQAITEVQPELNDTPEETENIQPMEESAPAEPENIQPQEAHEVQMPTEIDEQPYVEISEQSQPETTVIDNSDEEIFDLSQEDFSDIPDPTLNHTNAVDEIEVNGNNFEDAPYAKPVMPFTETVKKKSPKKYIVLAVVAAVVNFSILIGLFALGYQTGLKSRRSYNTNDVMSNLQNTPPTSNDDTKNAEQAVAREGELTTVEISKKVGPAVVGITSTIKSTTGLFGSPAYSEGTGSGIIISADGFIITNNHVIEDASEIFVTLNTGSEYEAELIGSDSKTDLAVLKISPKEPLTVAELGDSTTLEVGERAVAIGNPLGMEFFGSTTQGIISAVNRTITVENTTMTVIQTDAAINQGNSGGALVNAYGQVIGINAVKISSSTVEGMGFAIPISDAKPVLQDLIEHGYVKGRPMIGITTRDVNSYVAERQGWPVGVQVMGVESGSGAEAAGVKQGDIITKADGKVISNVNELNAIKDKHRAGETIKLEVYDCETGTTKTLDVTLSEQKP